MSRRRSGDGAGAGPPARLPPRLRRRAVAAPGRAARPSRTKATGVERRRRRRIRCPRCGWEPDGKPHWRCDWCGAVFDTFSTRARCPECPNRWRLTQCIACGRLSPHEDWYEDGPAG